MRKHWKLLLLATLALVVLVVGAALVVAQDPGATPDTPDDDDTAQVMPAPADVLLTEAQAMDIAAAHRGGIPAVRVELEREGGVYVYSVTLADGSEVELDARTGVIIEVELSGADAAGGDE